ncbi:hypothetical protein TNCV_2414491 [Trichonephila clavipes]|nr:hypothetical protein TNCV_2414491 [Trichonephila clavipes]
MTEINKSPSQYGGYVPRLVTEWVRVRIYSGLSPEMDSRLERKSSAPLLVICWDHEKRTRLAEMTLQERDIGSYSLRPRIKKAAVSRLSREEMHDQSGPKEEVSKSLDPTARSQCTSIRLDARVVRSRGDDIPAIRIHNEAEEPDSKNTRR